MPQIKKFQLNTINLKHYNYNSLDKLMEEEFYETHSLTKMVEKDSNLIIITTTHKWDFNFCKSNF